LVALAESRYDAAEFHAELVSHGLIVPSRVQGVFGRSALFEDVLARFNQLVSRLVEPEAPDEVTHPPVVDRRVLEKMRYLESFPHLCGAVHSFFGNELQSKQLAERAGSGEDWGEMLQMTDVVMIPAACYPVYPTLAGTMPESGRLISTLNWVFRHEPSSEPTRLQSFRMRELIRAGSSEQVASWRNDWLKRGLDLLQSLGLAAASDVASDPFFGRGGRVLATSQKEQKLKFEIVVPIISQESPTAIASFNFHQDHFASKFDILTADGLVANTACLGFGLERVTMALFKTHGFAISEWPVDVRKLLWR
jgi:seryl-tRNA synthetase